MLDPSLSDALSSQLAQRLNRIRNAKLEDSGLARLPLLPLRDQVVFPQVMTLIPLLDDAQLEAAQTADQRGQTMIACQLRGDSDAADPLERFHAVGTEIAPGRTANPRGKSRKLLAQGRRRMQIVAISKASQDSPFLIATARPMPDANQASAELEPLAKDLVELFTHSSQYNEAMSDGVVKHVLALKEPSLLCDSLAAILPLPPEDLQRLLELDDVAQRLAELAAILSAGLRDSELHEEVHTRLQDEIAANQREMYLREQLRVIQQELGDGDVFSQEIKELTANAKAADLPAEVHDKAMKEISRLGAIPPMSPESGVIHSYLDRLLTLPWRALSDENLDLAHAEDILESAHYGLKKVKARILEHIAVRKLARDKMKSPILCFVGPPGVGKTSLGKSIADALGCKFLRISLGGVRDEAEIRGHRRTYIGAMPGRILQQMERAETINPVFMLDEIDKMSSDFRGDPASAMLEVLDPEQNRSFVDHYLEVPYDLSKVTFITTANDLYSIPEALEDRLEVIEFKGYSEEQKLQIARRFLLPKQIEANGIAASRPQFTRPALLHIIRHYTYESGVRNLEREIANICRKLARQVAVERKAPRRVSPAIVEKLLGPPQLLGAKVNRQDAVGIVSGLVWTPNGGEIQTVEVSLLPGKGNLMLTGQLGDVLQESAHIALSYLRTRAHDFGLPPDDFENYDIHIHMPEGAVPKDGPSAGITLATALVSAFTERAVKADCAMSGEITLRGAILPVGGVVEKALAARRRKMPRISLPRDNQKDLRELPKAVMRDIAVSFVDDMLEVWELVLLPPPAQRQRDLEAEQRQSDLASKTDSEE